MCDVWRGEALSNTCTMSCDRPGIVAPSDSERAHRFLLINEKKGQCVPSFCSSCVAKTLPVVRVGVLGQRKEFRVFLLFFWLTIRSQGASDDDRTIRASPPTPPPPITEAKFPGPCAEMGSASAQTAVNFIFTFFCRQIVCSRFPQHRDTGPG